MYGWVCKCQISIYLSIYQVSNIREKASVTSLTPSHPPEACTVSMVHHFDEPDHRCAQSRSFLQLRLCPGCILKPLYQLLLPAQGMLRHFACTPAAGMSRHCCKACLHQHWSSFCCLADHRHLCQERREADHHLRLLLQVHSVQQQWACRHRQGCHYRCCVLCCFRQVVECASCEISSKSHLPSYSTTRRCCYWCHCY